MSARSVIHDSFTIERTYPAAPSRVFAAFASEEAKNTWGDTGGLESASGIPSEFDFRVGGRERFGHVYEGMTYRYDALYYDIVPTSGSVQLRDVCRRRQDFRLDRDDRVRQERRGHRPDHDRAGHLPGRHRRRPGKRVAAAAAPPRCSTTSPATWPSKPRLACGYGADDPVQQQQSPPTPVVASPEATTVAWVTWL